MQHYPHPDKVLIEGSRPKWPAKRLKETIAREGQIVPLLVRQCPVTGYFKVTDFNQAERLMAIQELGWDTILVETEWSPEDL